MKARHLAAMAAATIVGLTASFTAVSLLSANAMPAMSASEESDDLIESELEPELIPAVGTEGQRGWVYTKDLDGPTPSSPEEALRWQAERIEQGGRYISLYAEDGATVIGTFHVLAPHGAPTK